jgi:ROS/MUCR transcriptional regulator protein
MKAAPFAESGPSDRPNRRSSRHGPCPGHECDACPRCTRQKSPRCCRGDNPDYRLPALGSITPFYGALGEIAEDTTEQQCHVCGLWWKYLAKHTEHAHDLTAVEYRAAFGLAYEQPLKGLALRARLREVADERGLRPPVNPFTGMTRERRQMLSARPYRLQVAKARRPQSAENARRFLVPYSEAARGTDRGHARVNCPICGQEVALPPSTQARGYATCGRKECVHEYRIRHYRPPSNAKLDLSVADEIRQRAANGETQKSIGRAYGVSQATVSLIVLRKVWSPEDRPARADEGAA